jgi:RHS repeat-associated protein
MSRGSGRPLSTTDAAGTVTSYKYDANGNRLTETRAGVTTSYQYDASGRPTQVTYADGTSTRTMLNAVGKPAQTVDQLGRTTAYAYDDQGQLVSTTYPDGTTTATTYDANGRRAASTDRAGRTTRFAYDALGRLTKTTHPGGSARSSTYEEVGRVLASIDELGRATTYAYDALGRRSSVTDAAGNRTSFTYDAAGNQLAVTDSLGHSVQYAYDGSNRQVKTIYPDGTLEQTRYDALGNRSARIDQAGLTTKYGYDALGRLVSVTDALNQVTAYAYDALGNRISQTDANGHTTSFAYDAMGRRVSRTLPLGQIERFTYYADGQLKTRTDFNGRTTRYAYDAAGRLGQRTPDVAFSGEPGVTFTYTASGRRATMTDATGRSTYTYDSRDRLVSKATPEGTLAYTYDAAGDRLRVKSDSAKYDVSYGYDALNRLSTVTDNAGGAAASYSYDAGGSMSGVAYGNGISTQYGYDALNRLTSVTVGANLGATVARVLASYTYALYPTGNRQSVTEQSGRRMTWSYDGLWRLTNETIAGGSANGSIAYTYDSVGNRLSRTSSVAGVPSTTSSYDNNDRLMSDSWDPNGNTVQSGASQYGYDSENRLLSLNKTAANYVYDGDGQLVQKTVGVGTTTYLIDDQTPAGYTQIAEERLAGAVTKSYVYGPQRISMRDGSGLHYYGYDAHSGVRLLMDGSGNVTDTWDYDAFGNLIARTGSTENSFTYRGEQMDSTLRLQYLRARWMDPGRGRFWTRDTYEGVPSVPAELDAYSYSGQNPVVGRDPSGHETLGEVSVTLAVQSTIQTLAISTALASTVCVADFAASTIASEFFDLDTTQGATPCANKRRAPGQIRIQLQDSYAGLTKHTLGYPLIGRTGNPPGVTVNEVQAGMALLYADVAFRADWFPLSMKPWLGSSIVSVSRRLNRYPPGGISGRQLGFESEKIQYSGTIEYRIDVDNLRGTNLRQ